MECVYGGNDGVTVVVVATATAVLEGGESSLERETTYRLFLSYYLRHVQLQATTLKLRAKSIESIRIFLSIA